MNKSNNKLEMLQKCPYYGHLHFETEGEIELLKNDPFGINWFTIGCEKCQGFYYYKGYIENGKRYWETYKEKEGEKLLNKIRYG